MSLRARFMIILVILGGLLVAFGGFRAYEAYNKVLKTEAAADMNQASEAMIQASVAWAAERGTTQAAIGSGGQVGADEKTAIRDARKKAAAELEIALTVLRTHAPGVYDEEIAAIQKSARAVDGLRPAVDRMLDRGTLTESNVRSGWFPAMTNLIKATTDLRRRVETEVTAELPGSVIEPILLRDRFWQWSEYLDRQQGLIAGILASERAMTPNDLRSISEASGGVGIAIEGAQVHMSSLPPGVRKMVNTARGVYTTAIVRMRTQIEAAGMAGTPYPMTAEAWIKAVSGTNKMVQAGNGMIRGFIDAGISDVRAETEQELQIVGGAMGVVLVLILVGFWITQRHIVGPVKRLIGVMDKLASGDLDIAVPDAKGRTEFARMAQAIERFREQARDGRDMQIAQKEAEQRAAEDRRQAILRLAEEFENAIGAISQQLASSSSDLAATASQVSGEATRTAAQSRDLHGRAGDAGRDIRQVADSVQQLDSAVTEVAHQVQRSAGLADRSSTTVQAAATRVRALDESSAKIGEVVQLISEIAEQTNLLALNATIEAARAGDAGKGFAVVANEVKSLANQTAKATNEISSQVSEMLTEIQGSAQAVEEILKAVGDTSEAMATISATAEEQSGTTANIARAVRVATERLDGILAELSSVADAAASTSDATGQVHSSAEALAKSGTYLADETAAFLTRVRG